jgi:hypothetical protein
VTCDEAIRAIEAMIDREIDDDERMQLEAHLAECEACRRETDERRAFSDRLGRDLDEALRPAAGAPRRIVFRPRRFPWVRAAAVIIVGFGIGYVGSATGFFKTATAEAHEVARLSALKDAYQDRNRELAFRVEQEASVLDQRAARAPEGPLRDAVTLSLMNVVSGLAGGESLELPEDPAKRASTVARLLSERKLSRRGLAVQAMRQMSPMDVAHVENQIVNLNGTNRTFTELWVLSVKSPTDPAVTLEIDGGAMRFVQLQNARVRVVAEGPAAVSKVYEGLNFLDFRARYPDLALQLRLRGTDGNFSVVGVEHNSPAVESRPAVYVPAVIGNDSNDIVEALTVQAVMADCARLGGSVDEAERRAREVMRRVHETTNEARVVTADPERVQRYLASYRKLDGPRLMLARERVQDDMAAEERRLADWEGRLDCLRKAAVTLDYLPK